MNIEEITSKPKIPVDEQKIALYITQMLYEKKLISDSEKDKMIVKINHMWYNIHTHNRQCVMAVYFPYERRKFMKDKGNPGYY